MQGEENRIACRCEWLTVWERYRNSETIKMIKVYILLLSALCMVVCGKEYVRVCYYTNWAQYRPPPMKFFPEDIDPQLCTHIMYAFAKIGDDHTLQPYEWNDRSMYHRIIALKEKKASLKILLAVGGWNHEATPISKFSTMVNNDNYRNTFIASVVTTLRKYGFDGLDLDWEYPAGRNNSPPGDKQKYTQLCSDMLDAFKEDASARNQERLMLSAAVAGGVDKIKNGYEISKLANYLDLLNVMTYDFHGNFDEVTGHHTAMEYDGGPGAYRKLYTVRHGIGYWLDGGFPPEKIALGLATYGRPFRLAHAAENGLAAEKSKWQQPRTGKYTRTNGFLAYYEICNEYVVVNENAAGAPYGYHGTDWCGFDTAESLIGKVNDLVVGKGLAGVMFWSLALDDFNGSQCQQGNYPLITAIKQELERITGTTGSLSQNGESGRKVSKQQVSHIRRKSSKSLQPPATFRRKSSKSPEPIATSRHQLHKTIMERHPMSSSKRCHAIGAWSGNRAIGLDEWCANNCAYGSCPPALCQCDVVSLA